ncbi:MAG: S8 family serine peptidase [Bdellovibrionales bacterium]|nr:S8 family serine peptidase [Bdellovibrionales bacterium]
MMKMLRILPVLFIAVAAQAGVPTTIGIIDSGVDYKHTQLTNQMWTNSGEVLNDTLDNDGNGFADDVYGWNFAEKNNQVIDYKYLGTFSRDPYTYFEYQLKSFEGTISQAEKDWVNQKRQDQNFMAEMSKFGNFVHGTHVAGISAKGNMSKIMGLKIIPTEAGGLAALLEEQMEFATQGMTPMAATPFQDILIKQFLGFIADQNTKNLIPVAEYQTTMGVRVANGSFGSSVPALREVVKNLLTGIMKKNPPTDAECEAYAKYTVELMLQKGKAFAQKGPDTFFVFAAGNDGEDNDVLPVFPAGLRETNTISVAATHGLDKLAVFSNYGKATVDVAAPGVGILSAIPGNEFLRVSGTSQAAPFVTNVIAKMLEENPNMNHQEIRSVIMETVDKKDWLVEKVISGGIVNPSRAVYAASLMKTKTRVDAISTAIKSIPDMVVVKSAQIAGGVFLPMPQLIVY